MATMGSVLPLPAMDQTPLAAVPAVKPIYQPPRGLLGSVFDGFRNAFTGPNASRNWRVISAAARQLNTGGNDLETLMQTMNQERQQYLQNSWQQTLQQHQLGDWKTQDQQEQAASTAAAQAPESIRPLAEAIPMQYAQAALTNALRPVPRLLTPEEVTQNHLQPGTVAQLGPNGLDVVQQPYHPPQAVLLNNNTPEDTVDMAAQSVLQFGALPPGMQNRNPAMTMRVYNRATELGRESGMTPAQIAAQVNTARANTTANQTGLNTNARILAQIAPAERAAQDALVQVEHYSSLVGRTNSPAMNIPLNQWNEQMNGDPNLSALRTSVISFGAEYARVLVQTGQSTDAAREHANAMFNVNLSPRQMLANAQVARADMAYRRQELQAQGAATTGSGMGSQTQLPPPVTEQMPAHPNVGDLHRFPNGRIGRWDGHGWVAQ